MGRKRSCSRIGISQCFRKLNLWDTPLWIDEKNVEIVNDGHGKYVIMVQVGGVVWNKRSDQQHKKKEIIDELI